MLPDGEKLKDHTFLINFYIFFLHRLPVFSELRNYAITSDILILTEKANKAKM